MSVRLAGILSLMLNVVLVATWLNLRSQASPRHPQGLSPSIGAEKPKKAPGENLVNAAEAGKPDLVDSTPPWFRIESEDFPTLIRNLKDVGCPDRTIRDIVSHEIERIFENRQQKAAPVDQFWWTETQRYEHQRREELSKARLELEKRSVLKTLLGVEGNWPVSAKDPIQWALFSWGAAIPEMEAVEKACWIIDSAQFQKRYFEAEAGKPLTLDELSRLKAVRDDTLLQMQSAIGRQRAEELLQLGNLGQLISQPGESGVAALGISSDELRRISTILPADLTTFDEIIEYTEITKFERFIAGLPPEPSADERMESLAPAVTKALGPRRAATLTRLFDENWQGSVDFAQSTQLPLRMAEALSDLKHTAAEESKRLRDAPDLEPRDEAEQLEAVSQTTLLALKQLLPDKAFTEYLKREGQWITNMAKGLKP